MQTESICSLTDRQAIDAEGGRMRGHAYVTMASGYYTTSMFTRTSSPVRTHTHTHKDVRVTDTQNTLARTDLDKHSDISRTSRLLDTHTHTQIYAHSGTWSESLPVCAYKHVYAWVCVKVCVCCWSWDFPLRQLFSKLQEQEKCPRWFEMDGLDRQM